MVRKRLFARPILVGGLGVTASLGLLGGLHDLLADGTLLASLIAAGTGIWWWRRQPSTTATPEIKPVIAVERETVEAAIAALTPTISALQTELTTLTPDTAAAIAAGLEQRRQALVTALDRTVLQLAIVGDARSGKSSLHEHLKLVAQPESDPTLSLTEVPLTPSDNDDRATVQQVLQYDAVLYLVTEDLTDSALNDIKSLTIAGQRVLVCLNKQDNFLPRDRAVVLEQIQSRLQTLPQPVDSVAIAAAPRPIKVRTYDAEGQADERIETPLASVSAVTDQVTQWLQADVAHLVAQTVMRQVHHLRREIQGELNRARHQQALPLVEQLQWTAAATAFASPVPSLDMLAAIAINGQLVMDLGRVYQQPLALDQAKAIATELAKVVVKLGIVEVSSQLLTTALKSHAATFVVGGGVQAFSAAYLTRLCGESLMAYFEERALSGQAETAVSVDAIGNQLQTLLPRTQRTEFLQSLIQQGIHKLTPKPAAIAAANAPELHLDAADLTTVVAHAEPVSARDSG